MATKKAVTEENAAVVEESGRVKISLPRARKGEDENLLVGINGVNYIIPKGKEVDVPAFVAEEVARSQKADDFMHDRAEELQKQAQ